MSELSRNNGNKKNLAMPAGVLVANFFHLYTLVKSNTIPNVYDRLTYGDHESSFIVNHDERGRKNRNYCGIP